MKLVLSPAKSLDFETPLPTVEHSKALFLKKAQTLNNQLKEMSPKSLSKLMNISDALGQLNYQRNQSWRLPFSIENARPAIYAFDGGVYKGLDAYTIAEEQMGTLKNTVRILSGLYGVLKPSDLIQPYRLEMGTKLAVDESKNLYEFWRKEITQTLNEELQDHEPFINLASNEYFKAIDTKALKVPVVQVEFKDFKNGDYKIISFFAKQARGLMARYIIDTNAKTVDDLKGFDYQGYHFSEPMSHGATNLVFIRSHAKK